MNCNYCNKHKEFEEEANKRIINKSFENQIERLNNIINELKKEVGRLLERQYASEKFAKEQGFEEMVGFVENVYKDIKSQSTLHEELEEERKTIAKIVGDFKEINK